MQTKEFIKTINNKRKAKGWYTFTGNVNDKDIRLKGFKTWLQVFSINGVDYSSTMGLSVKDFNSELEQVK